MSEIKEQELQLFNQYQPLAYKVAYEFSKRKPWIKDEIESAALYGLWEAVKQEAKGNPISFYSVIIRNQITDQARRMRLDRPLKNSPGSWRNKNEANKEKVKILSINFYDSSDESFKSGFLLEDTIRHNALSAEDILIKEQEKRIRDAKLEKAISELSKDQQHVIRSMLNGKTSKELSFEKGCTINSINNSKYKAIRYLQEKLN